jgi:hypothetical protein
LLDIKKPIADAKQELSREEDDRCGTKKDPVGSILPNYSRLLAMNDIGQSFLNKTKKNHNIKIYSKITKKDIITNPQLKRELVCNDIYNKLKL